MKATIETNYRAQEIADSLFPTIYTTSHYATIDNVLVRISNHMPKAGNLEEYNNIDEVDGVVFVFIKDTMFDFQTAIEKEFGDSFNYEVVELEMEDEFTADDLAWYIKRVK